MHIIHNVFYTTKRNMADMNLHLFFSSCGRCDGTDGKNLRSWFKVFEECCIKAGQKNDEMRKGRLLMLCLSGRALEVAEQLETERNEQQTYTSLMTELLNVFCEPGEQKNQEDSVAVERPLVHSIEMPPCDTTLPEDNTLPEGVTEPFINQNLASTNEAFACSV